MFNRLKEGENSSPLLSRRKLLITAGVMGLTACGWNQNSLTEVRITNPSDQGLVRTTTDISGTVNADLGSGSNIFIVLRGEGDKHLHPQREPAHFIDSSKRNWLLEDATFGYPGNAAIDVRFDVFAVLADSFGTRALMKYLRTDGPASAFPGLDQLPGGVEIRHRISVMRPANS